MGTNGTYLDGKRITQTVVTDGAVIRLARSGPNIQVRIGEAAYKELSETLPPALMGHHRSDELALQTEITGRPSGLEESVELDDPKNDPTEASFNLDDF